MKLKKELKLIDVFCITTGTMISAGLFILPGIAHSQTGPSVILSYFLAGIMTIPGMLSQAELSTAMPKAGGSYYFITRSMGPAIGTVYGMITWFALTFKSAFALVGIKIFASQIVNIDPYLIAASLCIVFVLINLVGIKEAGRIQVILVFVILSVLLVYIITGIKNIEMQNLVPFAPFGSMAVLSTAGFVFISYGGLLKVASVAEEVKDPGRVLPLAMILSLLVVLTFYILVVFTTTGVLESSVLSQSLMPVSDGGERFLGSWGRWVLNIVAVLAFVSAANAGIMAASRYPMALGRDEMLPKIFGAVNSRFKTPHVSIMVTGLFLLITLFLPLDVLVKAASSVVILTYMFSCLSVIILKESRLQNYQPSFKSPLYPWIQIAGIFGFGFFLFEIGKEALFVTLIFIGIGLIIYFLFGREIRKREFALMHLIERITAKELTSHSLERELKEVIRERDEIVKDRFDHIIEESIIFDIDGKISAEDLFKKVSLKLAKKFDLKPKKLLKLFLDREQESSTVLTKGMAIPHIVIKGDKKFQILVARVKEGAVFSKDEQDVHAVFFLVGTKDERNFHLRALSAIAQIVQDTSFEKTWLEAKNKETLRDILLLSKRRR